MPMDCYSIANVVLHVSVLLRKKEDVNQNQRIRMAKAAIAVTEKNPIFTQRFR